MSSFFTEKILLNNKSFKILDFGCGNGEFVVEMAKAGFDVIGVDIVPQYVQIAKAKCESNGIGPERVILGSDGRIPFASQSFDVIYSNTVLEHVKDVHSYMRECLRVIRSSGVMFCTVPVRFSLKEEHIPLALAHWLPAGRLRRSYIRAFAPRGAHDLGGAEIGQYFDEYISRLNYWLASEWKNVFSQYFQTVKDITLEKKTFEAGRMATFTARTLRIISRVPVFVNPLRCLVRQMTTMNLIAEGPLLLTYKEANE